jgi:Fe-S cluster biogenesis protein NfuA
MLRSGIRLIRVLSEVTPNPEALVFTLEGSKPVLGDGYKSMSFSDKYSCGTSPLAGSLFRINGVQSVLLAPKHVTVNKNPNTDWAFVKPSVELVLSQFFATDMPPVRPEALELSEGAAASKTPTADPETIDKDAQIAALIDERVRPFVQQDGGDITYIGFDEASGTVRVRLSGSCVGCPKSQVTLKLGIERMIKHYVEGVNIVVNEGDVTQAS